VEDFLLLGEIKTLCQLINGELIVSPGPSPLHQRVSRRLFKLIDKATLGNGELFYAPIDLYINLCWSAFVRLCENEEKFYIVLSTKKIDNALSNRPR
jgi:hypothetical protein